MRRSRSQALAELAHTLIVLAGLGGGLALGLAAEQRGAADPALLHALAIALLGAAAAAGMLRGTPPRFPFSVALVAMAALLLIIVLLPLGHKHAGYALFVVIVGLASTLIQLVLP
jgi:hypothetical protein